MKFTKIIAIAMAACMLFGTTAALAEGQNGEEETPTYTEPVSVSTDDNITINGNVDVTGGQTAVSGTAGTVTITGDVTSEGYAIAPVFATVTVDGDVVSTNSDAIYDQYSYIEVKGDVISESEESVALYLDMINYMANALGGDFYVIVAGDVHSEGDTDLKVSVDPSYISLAFGSIDPNKVWVGHDSSTTSEEATQSFLSTIRYIVSVDDQSSDLTYEGTEDFHGYDTVHAGDELTVSVSPAKKGYRVKLTAGDYADVIKNDDGTWTVLVKDGGDLKLCAQLVKIQSKSSSTAPKKGSTVTLNTSSWIIEDITDGVYTLSSAKTFTAEELADMDALLETLLSDPELAELLTDDLGAYIISTDEEGHLIITCNAGILTADASK